jgi:uncharacterized protein YuzE
MGGFDSGDGSRNSAIVFSSGDARGRGTVHNAFPDRAFKEESWKVHSYPETDSLYIDLSARPSADSREVADGVVLDFDEQDNIVGIDIQQASLKLDLRTLETRDLPVEA